MTQQDTSAELAAHQLYVIFSRMRRKFLAAADTRELTPSQLAVLSRLGKSGPTSPSHLAAAERVRPQAITPILTALSKKGMIEYRTHDGDRRRKVVAVSAEGRAALDDGRRTGNEWLTRLLDVHCTPNERRTVIRAMAALDRAMAANEAEQSCLPTRAHPIIGS